MAILLRYYTAVLALISFSAVAANITVTVDSDSYWSSANGSIEGTYVQANIQSKVGWAHRWNLAPNNMNSPNLCSASGGFTRIYSGGPANIGYKISDGIILYFSGGDLFSTFNRVIDSKKTGTAVISSDGTMTNLVNTSYNSSQSQAYCTWIDNSTYLPGQSGHSASISNGILRVYVSPTAKPGNYTIPAISIFIDINGYVSKQIAPSGILTVVAKPSCTLSMPTSINFGSVSSVSAVIQQKELTVNCTNQKIPTDIKYRITPSITGTVTTIPMTNTETQTIVGAIRGFIGEQGIIDAGCVDKTSSLKMDGSSNSLMTVSVGASNTIPLVWTLCPDNSAAPGPAKASLSFEIDW